MIGRRLRRTLLATLLLALLGAVPASAQEARLTIRGAGFGHGVGMSQYGAMGMAKSGQTHRQILGHYYTGTGLGSVRSRRVRVLLQSTGSPSFSGATRAAGRRLRSTSTYRARRRGAAVDLLSASGRRLKSVRGTLRVTSSRPITLRGRAGNGRTNGAYRGAMEFVPAGSGLNVVNAVSLEQYLYGVVPAESPASWPLEALKAQAVAARTYALTTTKAGAGFEHYADTRSQVYGGVAAEVASTTDAVRQTRGEVVTLNGQPVVTYFFSTSGGRTEDVENTSLGNRPLPWLKSVDDPHDRVSPRHRWGPIRMTLGQADRKLGGLVKGDFRGIEVVRRGVSPRIVEADVVGTDGRTRVTGAQLRAELGLHDTWAFFTSVSTGEEEPPPAEEAPTPAPPPAPADPNGGIQARRAKAGRKVKQRWIGGRIVRSARGGHAVVEIRTQVGWRRAGTARIRRDGRYRFGLCAKGAYRVRVGKARGPVVRIH